MAQKSTLFLDEFERRYYETVDSIDTVLTASYFNPFKRELEVNEIIWVRTAGKRYKLIIDQLNPDVTSSRAEDSSLRDSIDNIEVAIGVKSTDPIITEFTAANALGTTLIPITLFATDDVGALNPVVSH